ncbi:MAG: hypothetical protein Q9162_006481 [Coniocarpon cinnabarinum]
MAPTGQTESIEDWQNTLEEVNLLLKADPGNDEYLSIRSILEQQIAQAVGEAKEFDSAAPPPPPPLDAEAPPPPPAKWSKEDHPAFQPGYHSGAQKHTADESKAVEIKVNEHVLARWPGDGRDYKAKVMSVTGSRATPMYTVKWNVDGSTDTLRASDVKPISYISDLKKRKADGATAGAPQPPPSNPGVISAAASINPAAVKKARPEPSKCSDGPTRPEKKPKVLGSQKALDKNKSSWQAFQQGTKAGKKANRGQSMFRTGESVNARVGFTGSGKPMSKDQAKSRHTYGSDNVPDEE